MTTQQFTLDDLMDLLVTQVGLPSRDRTDRRDVTLADLGLDSLALLQLQSELQSRYGIELVDADCATQTVGGIVDEVNATQVTGAA